jgi:hypothetical protein
LGPVAATILVLVGLTVVFRFRAIADWFDRVLRALADGPGEPEPRERGLAGLWLMAGTGSDLTARWVRRAAVLGIGMTCVLLGAGELSGLWAEP